MSVNKNKKLEEWQATADKEAKGEKVEKKKNITFSLPEELIERIRLRAFEKRTKQNLLVAEAVEEYLTGGENMSIKDVLLEGGVAKIISASRTEGFKVKIEGAVRRIGTFDDCAINQPVNIVIETGNLDNLKNSMVSLHISENDVDRVIAEIQTILDKER